MTEIKLFLGDAPPFWTTKAVLPPGDAPVSLVQPALDAFPLLQGGE